MDDKHNISYIQLRISQGFLQADKMLIGSNYSKQDEASVKTASMARSFGYLEACRDFGILSDCTKEKLLKGYSSERGFKYQ